MLYMTSWNNPWKAFEICNVLVQCFVVFQHISVSKESSFCAFAVKPNSGKDNLLKVLELELCKP